jgi:hypothetical protein
MENKKIQVHKSLREVFGRETTIFDLLTIIICSISFAVLTLFVKWNTDLTIAKKIILTILAAFILAILVAALSCNLSCSGNESLAIIVLVAGWAWILVLGFLAIRAILRKHAKSKELLVPDNPAE